MTYVRMSVMTNSRRDAAKVASSLDPWVIASLKEIVGPAELKKILNVFKSELEDTVRMLRLKLKSSDLAGVQYLAHRLKGACLQLGATRCAELASELDCRDIDCEQAEVIVDTLHLDVLDVADEISACVQEVAP